MKTADVEKLQGQIADISTPIAKDRAEKFLTELGEDAERVGTITGISADAALVTGLLPIVILNMIASHVAVAYAMAKDQVPDEVVRKELDHAMKGLLAAGMREGYKLGTKVRDNDWGQENDE